jgi:peptidoglycan/LPS O-acetylase OafA/YrhL
MYWLNNYPDDWSRFSDVTYLVLNKAVFVFCFFFVVYPAMLGKACLIRKVLGHPIFLALGKTTYAAYMYHPMMMEYYTGSEQKGESLIMINISRSSGATWSWDMAYRFYLRRCLNIL